MQGPIPTSGAGYKALGHTGTDMGMPHPMSSDRSEMSVKSKAGKTDKSKPKPPADAKKWTKKGYNMTVPATDAEGKKIKDAMKAH